MPKSGPDQQQRPRKPHRDSAPAPTKPDGPMRIAKAMAQAGLCSRRDAERWIEAGRVSVNGKIITSPALDVGSQDTVVVDGNALPEREPTRLWRYHKPRGLVTTHRDPQGRDTVFDNLPADLPRVISIGRLDYNTEGLLLLTTDGALARHLELPATGWLRRYRVRAHGNISQTKLDTLKGGCEIEGTRYGPIEASLESQKGANCWIAIALREGKNREVRNVLGSLGLTVNRLIRVSFGPFQLLDLKPGDADQVKRRILVDQLGPALVEQFNLSTEIANKARQRSEVTNRPSRSSTSPSSAARTATRGGTAGGKAHPKTARPKTARPKTENTRTDKLGNTEPRNTKSRNATSRNGKPRTTKTNSTKPRRARKP